MLGQFEEALAHEPLQKSEYEEALAKGRRALPLFYDEYRAGWSPKGVNEERVDGVESGGVKIKGNLDRIEFLEGSTVRVVDYKTGKMKSRNDIEGKTQSSDGNYFRQLVFYKLLLDKQGKYDMREGVIQFVEPDERGKFRREPFPITTAEVAELEAEVARIAGEIKTLAFWDKGCKEPDCQYCELREGMG